MLTLSESFLLDSSNAMLSDVVGAAAATSVAGVGAVVISTVVGATFVETTLILLFVVVASSDVVTSIGCCVGGIQGLAGTTLC